MIFLSIVLVLFMLFILWRIFFLRNPIRTIPQNTDAIVSPADGYVMYIKRIDKGEIPMAIKKGTKIFLHELCEIQELNNTSGWLVGIFMTPWSVHFNRFPLSGEVVFKKYLKHKSALSMVTSLVEILTRSKKFSDNDYYLINERLTIGIKTISGPVIFVTQIADKWINRIVSFVGEGDKLKKGEQYGMIRFGSQCDLFLPDNLNISFKVNVGEYVFGGTTIIGSLNDKVF